MATLNDLVTFGVSTKGRQTVIYRNFEYVKVRENKNGEIYWRCKMYQIYKCNAHLKTLQDRIVSNKDEEHTHQGNTSTSMARLAVAQMKEKMCETSATPAAVVGLVSRQLDDHILQALPKPSSLARSLQRHRKAALANNDDGAVLPPPPADTNFDVPQRFSDLILYDSGKDGNRVIIFGSHDLLDGLARAKLWLADGTFKVVPSIFFQLYTIHFELVPGINPVAVYCLVTNKERATYGIILNQLKILIPAANPERILLDFETAAMSAFEAAYPNAAISGCYFHLCQSVLRKMNEVGMKQAYETDTVVRGAVRCIPALALVPVDDVIDAFELLADEIGEVHERMPELLSYFEHTYIRGRRRAGRLPNYGPSLFPIQRWNQHQAAADGIARTTNAVEGWHYGLQSLFQCHHPTLWAFLEGMSKDLQKQKAIFLQGISGVSQQPRKKYRDLNARVGRAVNLYLAANVLQFLRAIAHLSHE